MFNDFGNEKNELFIKHRNSVEEEWKTLYRLPPTGKSWIYNSVEIPIPDDCLNKETQFSIEYNNNNEDIPVYIRLDNFIINNFLQLQSPKNLISDKNSKTVFLEWSAPINFIPDKYFVYRNLKKIGETKNLIFEDQDFTVNKTYYYGVKAVYGDSIGSVSNISNLSIVNPDPVFNLPYFESFDKHSNFNWENDRVFWDYQNNQNLEIKTNNPTAYFGFKLLIPEWQRYDSWFVSPTFQAVSQDSIVLSFKYLFKCYYPEQFQNLQIYFRTGNDYNWTFLEELPATPSAIKWKEFSMLLPQSLLERNFQIAFFAHRTKPYSGLFVGGIDDISIKSIKGAAPPENFDFIANDRHILLNWTKPVGAKPQKYLLYRNDTLIGESNTLTYNDYGVQNHVEYNYKVIAVYGENNIESLAAEITTAISMYGLEPPYFWDFEENYNGWDISENPVGWMWGKRASNESNKYLYTKFELYPPQDIIRSPYLNLDFEGSLFLSFDYCSWGGNFKTFQLMYRSVKDSSWTILQDLEINLDDALPVFERKTILLPETILQECVQFAFYFQNDNNFFGYSAIDNFLIEGKKGVYSPDSLGFAVSDRRVDLFWEPPLQNRPDYYKIYRDDSLFSISYTTNYTDFNVSNGVDYSYKISAVFGGNYKSESLPTKSIIVIPFPFENCPYKEDFENDNYKWFTSQIKSGFILTGSGEQELANNNHTMYMSLETSDEIEAQITSPLFVLNDNVNVVFSFDYYLEKYFALNKFILLYRKNPNDKWKEIIELQPTNNQWKSLTVPLPNEILSDSLQLKFLFTCMGNTPSVIGAKIDNLELFSESTNIKFESFQPEVLVFPNPGDGIVYVDCKSINDSDISIEVYNNEGRMVFSEMNYKSNLPIKIDLRNHNCGIYYLRILINNIPVNRKLIIR